MFSDVVYTLEVKPIYAPIDWKSTMSFVWVVLAILVVISVHLLSHLIWIKLRKKRVEKSTEKSLLS